MTKIVDLTTGDAQSSLVLLHQCEQLRHWLLTVLQASFVQLSHDVLPIMADGKIILARAAERQWAGEQRDEASQEIIALNALCRQIDLLLRSYLAILAQAPQTPDLDMTTQSPPSPADDRSE